MIQSLYPALEIVIEPGALHLAIRFFKLSLHLSILHLFWPRGADMIRLLKYSAVSAFLLVSLSAFCQRKPSPGTPVAPAQPIRLAVDATHAPEKIISAQLQIPVLPGPLVLVYPKWIPGEHGPTGPIVDLTGVQFYANGQRLTWQRDLTDMFAFHLTVPPEGFSSGASSTTQLDMLSWNQVLLYPPGKHSDDIQFTASLKLPADWHYGTALPVESEGN